MKKFLLPLLLASASMTAWAETQESWALVEGPDGLTWSLATVADLNNLGNEYYNDFRYNKISVTLSDALHQIIGTFDIDVADLNANDVQVFGPVTNHLFNKNDQYEVGVQIHVPGNSSNNYTPKMMFRAYSLDGEKVFETDGAGYIVADGDNSRFILQRDVPSGTYGKSAFDVYRYIGMGFLATHTFEIDNKLTNYLAGSPFNTVNLSDGIHYILSYYEKSYVKTDRRGEEIYDPETWMPVLNEDNYFIIQNYNSAYELVDEVRIPTGCPEGILMRLMGFGLFSDIDLSEGYFTCDDKYNYVITCSDTNLNWAEQYAFDVYAQGNEYVGAISKAAGSFWKHLASIEGEPEQWAILESDGEGNQQLSLIEVPGLNHVCTIPATLDGKLISSNIDRMPDAAETYKYVIGLNEPATDADDNVIAQYGIYHKDFTVDDYVLLNMGPNAETFTPLVNDQSLDPHIFYADDQHEFIFLSKVRGNDGKLYGTLYIGNEAGEVLNVYTGDGTTKGDISNVAILNYGSEQPELFISYYDQANERYTNEFIKLPLTGSGIEQIATSAVATTYDLFGRSMKQGQGFVIRNGKKMCVK